jgi:hypothetical protein
VFNTTMVTVHTVGSTLLLRQDADFHDFLRRLGAMGKASGLRIYAYCLMGNHVHFLMEGAPEVLEPICRRMLSDYSRAYRARHVDFQGQLFVDPFDFRAKTTEAEIKNAVKYLHENPTKAGMVARSWEYPWSSARAFIGLTRVSCVSVDKVRQVLGKLAQYAVEDEPPPTPDLGPIDIPMTTLPVLLGAASQTYALDPLALGTHYAQGLRAVRTLFVRLARLEGYSVSTIARYLQRVRQYVLKLSKAPVDPEAFRIARTLARVPSLALRLPVARPEFKPSPFRGRPRRRKASATEVTVASAQSNERPDMAQTSRVDVGEVCADVETTP